MKSTQGKIPGRRRRFWLLRLLTNVTPFIVKRYPAVVLLANRVSCSIIQSVSEEPLTSDEEQRHLAALERVYRQQQLSLRSRMTATEAKLTAIRQLRHATRGGTVSAAKATSSNVPARTDERSVGPTDAVRDAVRNLSQPFGTKDVFANLQKQHPTMAARISRARISVILSKLVARGEISAEHGGPGKKSVYQQTARFGVKRKRLRKGTIK
jgi:hypothetical protein